MKQSHLFTKVEKETPKDEVSKNAKLLIQAGFIHKESAGVYSFLPLGFKVLNNINKIIREEMDAIGGQELLLSALQDKVPWELTDRWSDETVDIWFKTTLSAGGEMGLGFTHEEPLTQMLKSHVRSYRDLPVYPYQIQTKFRNEERAKSGIMRGREFVMKDLYSFSRNQEEHDSFYEKIKEAYQNVFKRVGLGDKTFITFASGGSFSEFSHEFQTICETGEDTIYLDMEAGEAINEEIFSDEIIQRLGLNVDSLKKVSAVEVGNIFGLGTRFSEPLGLSFVDEDGSRKPVIMGSYGIGSSRLVGVIAEVLSDENGLIWPVSIAPYNVHIVAVGENEQVFKQAEELHQALSDQNISVLYDDRDKRAGEKFAESDLMGLPVRVVVSEKTMQAGEYEVKIRAKGETYMIGEQEALSGGIQKIIQELHG